MGRFGKILILLPMFAFLLILFSCQNQKAEVLSAVSDDYINLEKLTSGSLDDLHLDDGFKNSAYDAFQCYVSKTNSYGEMPERLTINNARRETERSCFGDNGYFVGMDSSEFASGIFFRPYTGLTAQEGTPLPTGRCIYLSECHKSDRSDCFAVTSWNYYDEEDSTVSLFRLLFPTRENNFTYGAEKICVITSNDNAVAATDSDSGIIYVATENTLFSVTADGTVTEFDVPKEWYDLQVNSLTFIHNDLFIGTKYGVLQYDLQRDCFLWFPVDYERIVPSIP